MIYNQHHKLIYDGYTLDVKRSPIEGSNIPDIVNRFRNLSEEEKRSRKEQSFMVPVDEIRSNDYDLSINKYKEVEREIKVYRPTSEILADIEKLNKELAESLEQLKKSL